LMLLALGMFCVVLVMVWVLVLVFIQPWCSAVSLTRQYPCHLLWRRPLACLPNGDDIRAV
jgi:hypothetical protein